MEVPAELVPVFGAVGGAAALLIRTGARWIRYRMLKARVRKEASQPGGPEFGTIGWVWNEFTKERSMRHTLEKTVARQGERIAALEGRSSSGEYRAQGPNDTDPIEAPPPFADWADEPRTPADGAIARNRRRSRP